MAKKKRVTREQLEAWLAKLQQYETELHSYIEDLKTSINDMGASSAADTEPPNPPKNPPGI